MTLVFVLIVVTATLMMVQKLVVRTPPDSGTPTTLETEEISDLTKLRVVIQLLITVVGLSGGGYVVLYGDYPPDVQYWAVGLIGSVFGFWLK
jgi:hypothetical protein